MFHSFKYAKLKFSVDLKKHTTWSESIPHGHQEHHIVMQYALTYHMTHNQCYSMWYATKMHQLGY